MDFDIVIGNYRLKMVDSVKVKHSVEQLSDTATVTLPAMVAGSALKVEDKLNVGDEVTIQLGYNDRLQTEFKGYLKSIETDNGNLALQCEDAIYLFDKKVKDEELKGVTLKALLEKVVKQVDPKITVETEFSFTWKKFTIYGATARDVLKKVQDETKANVYLRVKAIETDPGIYRLDKTLHVCPQYAEASGKTVVFDFARNIESSSLKYRKASDKKVQVTVELTDANGKKTEVKYGSEGGKSIKRVGHGMTEAEAKKIAENEHNLWSFDGYEGSFTGWLVPFVEPGDAVRLRDAEYPTKEGTYYVTGTEVSFSKEGGKRTISLGRWLSK